MKLKLTINLIIDYDCTCGVRQYEENDTHLIVIPRYYFGNYIDSWFKTKEGDIIILFLVRLIKKLKGFIFTILKMVMINIKSLIFLNLCLKIWKNILMIYYPLLKVLHVIKLELWV